MLFPFRKCSSFSLSTIDPEVTMKQVLDLVLKFLSRISFTAIKPVSAK